jgi:hypothetical protein
VYCAPCPLQLVSGGIVAASLLRRGQVHQVLQLISRDIYRYSHHSDSVYTISLDVDRANSEKAPSQTFDYARCIVYVESTSSVTGVDTIYSDCSW